MLQCLSCCCKQFAPKWAKMCHSFCIVHPLSLSRQERQSHRCPPQPHQQQKEPPDRQTREEEITRTVAGVAITIRQFQRATHHHCWQRHSSQPPSSYSSCSDMSHSHHKCLSISLHTHTSEILKTASPFFVSHKQTCPSMSFFVQHLSNFYVLCVYFICICMSLCVSYFCRLIYLK